MRKTKDMLLRGAGRLFDFARCYDMDLLKKYDGSNAKKADTDSVRSDWEEVGRDLRRAMSKQLKNSKS